MSDDRIKEPTQRDNLIMKNQVYNPDAIYKILHELNTMISHCDRCRNDQKRFGTYQHQSGLRAECLDRYVDLVSGFQAAGTRYTEDLVEDWREKCDKGNCKDAIESLNKVLTFYKSGIKERIDDDKDFVKRISDTIKRRKEDGKKDSGFQ